MFRRAVSQLTVFVAVFISMSIAYAQVEFENGEINLRGTLILKTKQPPTLVVNSGNRAMKSFELKPDEKNRLLSEYTSGTKVEVCMNVTEVKNKLQAELIKIRPLAPNEGVLVYTGKIKGCAKSKGCKEFGKTIEASLLGENAEIKEPQTDYFGCLL
jgi:hypothetical protein